MSPELAMCVDTGAWGTKSPQNVPQVGTPDD